MLKSYYVKVRNVKVSGGTKRLTNYFNNSEHKNHTKHNTKIIPLGLYSEEEKHNLKSKKDYVELMNDRIKLNSEKLEESGKKKRGTKLKIIGKSFTFNVPPKYNVTEEQLKSIYNDLLNTLKEIYLRNGCIVSEEEIYSVIHLQENSHIHMQIPYVDCFGNTMRFLKPKSFTNQLRMSFNKIVDKNLKRSINQYNPLTREEIEHNKMIRFLLELKVGYQVELNSEILTDKESKYIKNQIVSVDRLLNKNEEYIRLLGKKDKETSEAKKLIIDNEITLIQQIMEKPFNRIELNSKKVQILLEQKNIDNDTTTKINIPTYKK